MRDHKYNNSDLIEAERLLKLAEQSYFNEQSLDYLERAAHFFLKAGNKPASLKARVDRVVRATALKGIKSWERIEASYSLVYFAKNHDSENYHYHGKIYLQIFAEFMEPIQEQIHQVEQGGSLSKSKNLVHDQINIEQKSKVTNLKGFPLYKRVADLYLEIFGEDVLYIRYLANQAFFLSHSLQQSNIAKAKKLYQHCSKLCSDLSLKKYYADLAQTLA